MNKMLREIPQLTGKNFCPYTEPRAGRQHIWAWFGKVFPDPQDPGRKHFLDLLAGIMYDACDPRDRKFMCLSDVPSPSSTITASPYSGDELAAWWNEAATLMPAALLQLPDEPVKPQEVESEEPTLDEIDLDDFLPSSKRNRKSFDNCL